MILDDPVAESMQTVFDRWAAVYDESPNPLLQLEERQLAPILPPLANRHVLDVGCGTGRWLHLCKKQRPASLTGVDISAAMLGQARERLGENVALHQATCNALPIKNDSADVILCSFMLSYVADLDAFAAECARVASAGASVILSDMHPVTAEAHHWKRGFKTNGEHVEITAQRWPLRAVLAAFRRTGFEPSRIMESCFGPPEREIFARAGKESEFDALAAFPAIYILKLERSAPKRSGKDATDASSMQISGASCTLGPATAVRSTLAIRCGRIAWIGEPTRSAQKTLDLSGYLLLPGLINAHDHLEFGLFPNLGRNASATPYTNANEWAREIHRVHAATIAKHLAVSKETRLWWGAIRNLLCGVTTVCHHNPLDPLFNQENFPVRVLSQFGWAHSLAIDPDMANQFVTTAPDAPFILHAAEGTDSASAEEIFQLEQMHLLDERTVLVHGLGLGREGIALLNRRMGSLVACPTSNRFLFHSMPPPSLLTSIHKVALGSDSPLTAAGDLLDEIRCAHTDIGIDSHSVYAMATTQAAAMLHLRRGEGRIRKSAVADLIAVRDIHKTPATMLAQLTFDQIELVLLAGRVHLASTEMLERLSEFHREGLQPIDVNGVRRWIRAPLSTLFASAEEVLGAGQLMLGNKEVRYGASL